MFVGTIYDSFEALEETLGKLKLERPLLLRTLLKWPSQKKYLNV